MADSSPTVRYENVKAAVVVTIDRPQARNAIDVATADALLSAFRRFETDESASVLVLTGEGVEAFCAGADLKEAAAVLRRNERPEGPLGFTRLVSSKPTVAAVSGWCLGGGLELALWCDFRIATETARFGCAQRRFGAPLVDGGTQRLPRVVGVARALDLVITGRIIDAEEALRFGLITEITPAGGHLSRALDLAHAIAALPQAAMLADRRSVLEGAERPLLEGLSLESHYGGATIDAAIQGAASFAAGKGRGGSKVEL